MIAANADRIIAARLKGLRPADMVLVAAGAAPKTNNPVVTISPGIAYDWRWVRDLDIALYMTDDEDWPAMAKDIAMQRPAYLCVWNRKDEWGAEVHLIPTAQEVGRPVRTWTYELDFSPWFDFQNRDFIEGRRYARDEHGIPYKI